MALIIGLILLTVITILSLGGMRGITSQERMASNLRDRNLAFQAAESALRAAETALAAGEVSGCSMVDTPWDRGFWLDCWQHGGEDCPATTVMPIDPDDWGLAAAPSYRIERLSATNYGSIAADESLASAPLHRITAFGVGGTPDAIVILQITFMP